MSVTVKINDQALRQVLKTLKGKQPVGRIGVIGGAATAPRAAAPHEVSFDELAAMRTRKQGAKEAAAPPTNAQVLAAHEYGTTRMPQRSVLRVPLTDELPRALARAGAFSKDAVEKILLAGSLRPYMQKVMIAAETVVQGAFDTGGYGKWTAWKDPDYQNNAGMLLVDTTQLRKAITSEVSG